MPVIRVEVPAGTSVDTQESIRTAVKAAVLRTLAPKETRYDYVAVREVVGEIGDGVPLVEVDLRPGREPRAQEGAGRRHRRDPERCDGRPARRRLCPVPGEPGGESLLRRHSARALGAGRRVAFGRGCRRPEGRMRPPGPAKISRLRSLSTASGRSSCRPPPCTPAPPPCCRDQAPRFDAGTGRSGRRCCGGVSSP